MNKHTKSEIQANLENVMREREREQNPSGREWATQKLSSGLISAKEHLSLEEIAACIIEEFPDEVRILVQRLEERLD